MLFCKLYDKHIKKIKTILHKVDYFVPQLLKLLQKIYTETMVTLLLE